ncbi:MAG TPA: ubiquinone/menaquinone biosynthesis methyltransferase [Longimicrobiales bacterium]|nr:ubiquinone/menaquinone biosynthesis methyltransferase [Longimicrobiales bacterium]
MRGSAKPEDLVPGPSVQRMFTAIAPRYDLLNHLLSLNRDRSWRRRAVDLLLANAPPDGRYLDSCAGTLDLSVEIARRRSFRGDVLATDFSYAMLQTGSSKRKGLQINTACADALRQPFADASFDGAIVGFGVRNLTSIDDGFAEFARLIRPGGRLVVLEFTTPGWQPFRSLYLFYFRRLLPLIGRIISRHGTAYSYLPESVLRFPEPAELARRLERAGFRDVVWENYTAGIVAAHVGTRV